MFSQEQCHMANFLWKNNFNFQVFPRVSNLYPLGFFTESQHTVLSSHSILFSRRRISPCTMAANSPSPPVTSNFSWAETTKSLTMLVSLSTSFPNKQIQKGMCFLVKARKAGWLGVQELTAGVILFMSYWGTFMKEGTKMKQYCHKWAGEENDSHICGKSFISSSPSSATQHVDHSWITALSHSEWAHSLGRSESKRPPFLWFPFGTMFKNTLAFLLCDQCVGTRQVCNAFPVTTGLGTRCYAMPDMRWMLIKIKPPDYHLKPGLVWAPEAT